MCSHCYNLVEEPNKCEQCEAFYCLKCLMGMKKFTCKEPECTSNGVVAISKIDRAILNAIQVECQNKSKGCKARLKYAEIKDHLESNCVEKIKSAHEKYEQEVEDIFNMF